MDVIGLVLAFEVGNDEFELFLREGNFGHVQADSELVFGDVAVPEFVEILHKLGNPDSPFLSDSPDSAH